MKKALPGKHGDSISYPMLYTIMGGMGVGVVVGIIWIGFLF